MAAKPSFPPSKPGSGPRTPGPKKPAVAKSSLTRKVGAPMPPGKKPPVRPSARPRY